MSRPTTQVNETFTKEDALLIMNNFILHMPKTYRKRTMNWVIVKDLFRWGTSTGGSTSSCEMCIKMGIDPYGYTVEQISKTDQPNKQEETTTSSYATSFHGEVWYTCDNCQNGYEVHFKPTHCEKCGKRFV